MAEKKNSFKKRFKINDKVKREILRRVSEGTIERKDRFHILFEDYGITEDELISVIDSVSIKKLPYWVLEDLMKIRIINEEIFKKEILRRLSESEFRSENGRLLDFFTSEEILAHIAHDSFRSWDSFSLLDLINVDHYDNILRNIIQQEVFKRFTQDEYYINLLKQRTKTDYKENEVSDFNLLCFLSRDQIHKISTPNFIQSLPFPTINRLFNLEYIENEIFNVECIRRCKKGLASVIYDPWPSWSTIGENKIQIFDILNLFSYEKQLDCFPRNIAEILDKIVSTLNCDLNFYDFEGNIYSNNPNCINVLVKKNNLLIEFSNCKELLINTEKILEELSKCNVSHLVFTNNGLKKLPKNIIKFPLQILGINREDIQTFPVFIGDITSLRELHISDSSIRSLPESIGNLHSLEVLDIYNTNIKELPKSIKKLKYLKIKKYPK
jgi:hypothetical protein